MSVPATFIHDLGKRLQLRDPNGIRVRLYSDYPFPWRPDSKPADPFEHEALKYLRANPSGSIHEFSEMEGRQVLRYAIGRVMTDVCVKCHNEHLESPKHDWKIGDVRGVLEIVRPLANDEARISAGFRWTFILTSFIFVSMLILSMLMLFTSRRRERS